MKKYIEKHWDRECSIAQKDNTIPDKTMSSALPLPSSADPSPALSTHRPSTGPHSPSITGTRSLVGCTVSKGEGSGGGG